MPQDHLHQPLASQETQTIQAKTGMPSFAPPVFQLAVDDGEGEDGFTPHSGEKAVISQAMGSEDSGPATQFKMASSHHQLGPIQRNDDKDKDKDPPEYVERTVTLTEDMDQAGFKRAALKSLFGGDPPKVNWENLKSHYKAGTHTLLVDIVLIRKHRAANNSKRGIEVDDRGGVLGAEDRAKKELGGTPTKSKQELIDEINRRYAEQTGQKAEKPGDDKPGSLAYWNQVRDEVLFQNEYIRNLPEQVKKLIKFSTNGRKITAADIEKLFDVAKTIEGLDPSEVNDYFSRISGSTTDLDAFKKVVDQFVKERAERKQENEKREDIQRALYGKDEVYKKYKQWKGGDKTIESDLIASLKPEFNSIAEFEKHLSDFQKQFEREAMAITMDILEKYEGLLYREGERYKEQAAVNSLHGQLGGMRGHYKEFKKHAAINNARAAYDRRPGSIITKGSPPYTKAQADEAREKAAASRNAASQEVRGLSGQHPLLSEDHLPLDRRLDKAKMAEANPQELAKLIQDHVAARMKDIQEAKSHLRKDPELIYKMDRLMPQYYSQMGIAKGSIFDQVVQDKISDIKSDELIVNILLAVLAIALAIISYGAATPFIAGAAAAGGFGLSAYMAYDEYNKYTTQHDLADVGFADDPSMFWLVVAVAGAALDMGAAVKAMKAMGPAAKALNAGGELTEFQKALKALQEAGEIDSKIALAAEKAAIAKTGFKEASGELSKKLMGRVSANPFLDPDIHASLVKMAYFKIKEGVHSFHAFVLSLKQARKLAGLGEMSAEEMAKAKAAFEEALTAARQRPSTMASLGDDFANALTGPQRAAMEALDDVTFARMAGAGKEEFGKMLTHLGNKGSFPDELVSTLYPRDADELYRILNASESLPQKLDVMGGAHSRFAGKGFINFDLAAQSGIKGDISQLAKYFPEGSVSQAIANNPRWWFLEEISKVMPSGARITVRGGMSNKFFKKIFLGKAEGMDQFKIINKVDEVGEEARKGMTLSDGVTPVKGTIKEIVLEKL